jgi:enoyl-[acyl-carrier-protein] reductase (NADH)
LARSAAAGYATRGVRVNCVAPGLTRTPASEPLARAGSQAERASVAMHPLKQLAEPEDIASALEFFLRPENSFITGQVGMGATTQPTRLPRHMGTVAMLIGLGKANQSPQTAMHLRPI